MRNARIEEAEIQLETRKGLSKKILETVESGVGN